MWYRGAVFYRGARYYAFCLPRRTLKSAYLRLLSSEATGRALETQLGYPYRGVTGASVDPNSLLMEDFVADPLLRHGYTTPPFFVASPP